MAGTSSIDVVVVSYNSEKTLRQCVEPLAETDGVQVIVVDNASADDSVASISDLDVQVLALNHNGGFAYGCNRGWQSGSGTHVLFLNPDATIDEGSLRRLATVLDEDPGAGAVGPRIVDSSGDLEYSQRRFPRLRSTYAQAFFIHRIFPRAEWTDELVRDPDAYRTPGRVEWLSGACILVKREALERIGGWDDSYFMYGEDKELCFQLGRHGYGVLFEPEALVSHIGGASRPRAEMLPVLAASTITYSTRHESRGHAALTRLGLALGALTHAALSTKGHRARMGHLRSFFFICSVRSSARPMPQAQSAPAER